MIQVHTEKYPKRQRIDVEAPYGWDGEHESHGKKDGSISHFLPTTQHGPGKLHRPNTQPPRETHHQQKKYSYAQRVCDGTEHHAGFNFHCGWPTRSIIGEVIPGRYLGRRHVEICLSRIIEFEHSDWDRSVGGLVDDKGGCCEFVLGEWGIISFAHHHPVYQVEGNRVLRTEQKECRSNTSEPAR